MRVEWAVLRRAVSPYPGQVRESSVSKGELGSREQAQAWMVAKDMTRDRIEREEAEWQKRTGVMMTPSWPAESLVGWRPEFPWAEGAFVPVGDRLRANASGAYKSGEWVTVVGYAVARDRLCYVVEAEGDRGLCDLWPVDDAGAHYEAESEQRETGDGDG